MKMMKLYFLVSLIDLLLFGDHNRMGTIDFSNTEIGICMTHPQLLFCSHSPSTRLPFHLTAIANILLNGISWEESLIGPELSRMIRSEMGGAICGDWAIERPHNNSDARRLEGLIFIDCDFDCLLL